MAMTLATAVLTSACNDPGPTPTTSMTSATPTVAPPSTSATTTATPLTPAEKDLKSAEEAIGRYWGVLDELAADPK
ncbi:MAG: hypothetical protein ACRC35_13005, partial [Angustibacter sp.]